MSTTEPVTRRDEVDSSALPAGKALSETCSQMSVRLGENLSSRDEGCGLAKDHHLPTACGHRDAHDQTGDDETGHNEKPVSRAPH